MAEIKNLGDEVLENVAGGTAGYVGSWVTVCRLETGYLALRTQPCYDYSNEIRGSESYNGQSLKITGEGVIGSDGRPYLYVFNPRTGKSGWTNAKFLC